VANSPILQIPLLATSQASKETTINSMVNYLERAMNDAIQLDMANGNLTLPVTDFMRYMLFSMVNVSPGSILSVPNQKRIFVIDNRGNANALSVSNGADTKEVPADATVIFHSSATRLTYLSNSAWTGYDDLMPSEEPNGRHTFWRVKFLTGVVTNAVEVGELAMREGPTGTQEAVGGTAISSGDYSGSTPKDYAFDGNLSSVWRSQTEALVNGNTCLGYQFGSAVSISSIEVKMPAPSTDRRPTSGVVEYSDDGVTWFEGWQFSGWTWDNGIADTNASTHPRYLKVYNEVAKLDDVDVISAPPQDGQVMTWSNTAQKWVPAAPSDSDAAVTHRFWRVFVTEANDATYCDLSEIEFRTNVGVEEQAIGGTPISGGTLGGSPASNAFDANDTSIVSLSPRQQNYVGYDFLIPKKVTEIYIRNGSVAARGPKSFRIEWSDNGQRWQIAGVVVNKTDWTSGEEMLITPTLNFQEIPDGGTTGQVLAKNSNSDGDFKWADPSIPAGGTTGQVLAKKSAVTGDAEWIDPPSSGGTGGGTSFRGDFSVSADPAYSAGDTVAFENDIWLCLVDGTTTVPGLDTSWRNITADSAGGGGSAEYPPYTGNAGRILAVNSAEDGVEWVDLQGGTTSAAHKSPQWRILFNTNGGNNRVGLAELELRQFSGDVDAAVGGTAAVSSIYAGNANIVFDDNVNNYWLATKVADEWVSYTFLQEVTIREVVLTSISQASFGAVTAPKDFVVQYFDTTTMQWMDEWSVLGAVFSGSSESQTFANPNPVYDFDTVRFEDKTASATMSLADIGKVVRFVNAAAATYTIPAQADVPIPPGIMIEVIASTANDLTFAAAAGVTLKYAGSLTIKGPATRASLIKTSADEWTIIIGGAQQVSSLSVIETSGSFNLGTTAHVGAYIRANFTSDGQVVVLADSQTEFEVGDQTIVRRAGTGKVTITPDTGVTINTAETMTLRKLGSTVTLIKVGPNEWDLTGDVELAP